MARDYPLRTLLYLLGNQREPMLKAQAYRPDLLVLVLDDLAPPEKAAGRALVEGMIKEGALAKARVAVRVNGLDTLEVTLDLKAMVRPGVRALVVPRLELPGEVRELEAVVQDLERHAGLEVGSIRFLPALESPEALLRAGDIAGISSRVSALVLGEKLAELGTEERRGLAVAAALAGAAAVDAPYRKPGDREWLIEEARRAREMGYAGKAAIHPRQVAAIRQVFS